MRLAHKATRIRLADFSSVPMRAFHMSWFAFFICFFGWFGLAPLMPVIRQEFHLLLDIHRIGHAAHEKQRRQNHADVDGNDKIDEHGQEECQQQDADIHLRGEVEALASEHPALAAEDRYRAWLRDNRGRDAAAGRTLIGPHVGDLMVWHGPKGAPAAQASTGEQKALLVGLVLAHARLVAEMSGMAPLALLDEVAAHFDPRRRAALFEALQRIGGQVFLTGADPAAFADLAGRAQFLDVAPGRVERRG